MIRETYTPKGNLLNLLVACPHSLKPGSARRKLNRHCVECGEAVHRGCLKSTAPSHRGFVSYLETLRGQGFSPGQIFPQVCDWPRAG